MAFNQGTEVISCTMDNSTLVQKSHIENFNNHSQLIVYESQEALFYKEGQALDLFASGRHDLSTENVPLLKKFFGRLFHTDTPFPCEVFFINRVSVLDVLWGTPAPIVLEDPQYGLIVNVRSSGQTGLRVKDSRKFVIKVVGQLPEFTVDSIRRTVKGMMLTSLSNLIANTITGQRVGILEISTKLEELSTAVQIKLNEKLDDIGLEVVHFNIGTIFAEEESLAKLRAAKERVVTKRLESLSDTELEAHHIREIGKAKSDARAAEGYTYQQEREYDALEKAVENPGYGVGVGGGMGAGMGFGVVSGLRGNQPASPAASNAPAKLCPKCQSPVGDNAKFCGNCGSPLAKTCPKCGSEVGNDAKFCANCGQSLAPAKKVCPMCSATVDGGSLFCPGCGHKLS